MWPAGGAEQPMGMGMGYGPAATSPRPSKAAAAAAATHSSSGWQSPVPYLFGGLAAMLGLIALSLLALACSYWKLSGDLLAAGEAADADDVERQAGAGAHGKAAAAGGKAAAEHWREHVVVIMPGDERPTFLATPASGRCPDDAARGVVVSVGCGGGSEDGDEGRCVECGARSWPAARAAGGEHEPASGGSGSSVISER